MAIYSANAKKPVLIGYKDPDSTLDYAFLWKDWLGADETIVTSNVTVETGLTLVSEEINGGELTLNDEIQKIGSVVTVWISGGSVDVSYTVSCKVTTSLGRVDEKSFSVKVKQR